MNDTVGCLASCAFLDPETAIGLIVGEFWFRSVTHFQVRVRTLHTLSSFLQPRKSQTFLPTLRPLSLIPSGERSVNTVALTNSLPSSIVKWTLAH